MDREEQDRGEAAILELWLGMAGLMALIAFAGMAFAYEAAPYAYTLGILVSAVTGLRLGYGWLSILIRLSLSLLMVWWVVADLVNLSNLPGTSRMSRAFHAAGWSAFIGLTLLFPFVLTMLWVRPYRDPTKPRPRWWPYQ